MMPLALHGTISSVDSFSPSLLLPLQKLTCYVCSVACFFFPHFPSSAQKQLDVVSTSSTTNTSYPGSCELPRMPPGYFLSSLGSGTVRSRKLSFVLSKSLATLKLFLRGTQPSGVESLKPIPPPLP